MVFLTTNVMILYLGQGIDEIPDNGIKNLSDRILSSFEREISVDPNQRRIRRAFIVT